MGGFTSRAAGLRRARRKPDCMSGSSLVSVVSLFGFIDHDGDLDSVSAS
jgi:hypothetical protein